MELTNFNMSDEELLAINGGGNTSKAVLCVTGAVLMVAAAPVAAAVAAPAVACATFAAVWTAGAGLALGGTTA